MVARNTLSRAEYAVDSRHGPSINGTADFTPHNFPFHGLIDELKVYNHALTAEEVLGIFNAGKGDLQPAISIGDATITEGDPSIRYLGNFVSAREGGLDDPHTLVYGPDGALYVSTRFNNSILRYDAVTAAPLPAPGKPGAEFVSPGAGGLSQARGIAFGPDGNLYAVSGDTDAILRFDGVTGAPLGPLVASGVGGLDEPRRLLFHTDGYLYVTSVGGTSPAENRRPDPDARPSTRRRLRPVVNRERCGSQCPRRSRRCGSIGP